jgi:CheY-like chemotaxis protein
VRITTQFPLGLPAAHVDSNQLELALLNLVVNARDAMPSGGTVTNAGRHALVREADASGLAPGGYVCLSVSDTGRGMDEEVLVRATEPFFTTKEIGKGTGLGLSTVQGLAEQSGGGLVLKSRKGEGTTAEIWLPVTREDAAAQPVAIAQNPAGPAAVERPLKVLVVDDDGLVLMNTAAMLEDLGHAVFQATSGRAALDVLRGGPAIDLVITDQAMPGMTGVELAAAIRLEWPDVPVLLATGYAELPAGSDPSLPKLNKPFLQATLLRTISEVMDGRVASKEAAEADAAR